MRVAILGNSASGKTTLAKALAAEHSLSVLDLDTIAWTDASPPVRRDKAESERALREFCDSDGWVIEGCYGDLVRYALQWKPELVLMDVPAEVCALRARGRDWEPDKFASPAAQAASLELLIRWLTGYGTRDGEMSLAGHRAIFEGYDGPKRLVKF